MCAFECLYQYLITVLIVLVVGNSHTPLMFTGSSSGAKSQTVVAATAKPLSSARKKPAGILIDGHVRFSD